MELTRLKKINGLSKIDQHSSKAFVDTVVDTYTSYAEEATLCKHFIIITSTSTLYIKTIK